MRRPETDGGRWNEGHAQAHSSHELHREVRYILFYLHAIQATFKKRKMFPGASASNALGTLAVMYSCIHTLASQWHEEDDEIKCLGSGLLTGALYKVGSVE